MQLLCGCTFFLNASSLVSLLFVSFVSASTFSNSTSTASSKFFDLENEEGVCVVVDDDDEDDDDAEDPGDVDLGLCCEVVRLC